MKALWLIQRIPVLLIQRIFFTKAFINHILKASVLLSDYHIYLSYRKSIFVCVLRLFLK